jgi:glutathione peroxidase
MASTVYSQTSIHDFKFNSIDGEEHSFSSFKGKKILIVNTASECGFTPQYRELQALHQSHGDKLVIIGFPANNFGGQEPGDNSEIKTFCQINYGVTFLMAEKVSVAGLDIHAIFKWLCAQSGGDFDGAIEWNFEKFLLDENGKLINRFRSGVKPNSEKITSLLK